MNVFAVGEVTFELGRQDFGQVKLFLVRTRGHKGFFVKIDLWGCDAGSCRKDLELAGVVPGRIERDFGARADEAHVATEHIEELSELVNFSFAEPAADGRDARISCGGEKSAFSSEGRSHAAKFEDEEWFPELSGALLAKNGRAGAGDFYREGDEGEQRTENDKAYRGGSEVKEAFAELDVESWRHGVDGELPSGAKAQLFAGA